MSHTLSSAIIVMEITGQMHLLSPIIVRPAALPASFLSSLVVA
jgi:hypothetical protein